MKPNGPRSSSGTSATTSRAPNDPVRPRRPAARGDSPAPGQIGEPSGGSDRRDGRRSHPAHGLSPLRLRGSSLRGIDYELPVASAQVKSCLLLAGLLAEGETTIREPFPARDHTERMLAAMGAVIHREGDLVRVEPAERLEAGDVPVPGDFSSAAFFVTAALLMPGSDIELREVGINRYRIGLITILSRMGVVMGGARRGRTAGGPFEKPAMSVHDISEPGPEPTVTLHVRHAELQGATVKAEDVPAAIDELPLLALLGCFAEGETVVGGAAELRAKESDRIAAVVDGLAGLGADI